MSIVLRPVNRNDLKILRHWDEQEHVIQSDPNDDWDWENDLGKEYPWCEQYIAELDGRPIGFVQIIDPAEEETQYWGKVDSNLRAIDIWIGEKGDLGKGHGTMMMKIALEKCFENTEVKKVLIDPLVSNFRARRFYERLGFEFVEERTFGKDLCAVYELSRENWKAHL